MAYIRRVVQEFGGFKLPRRFGAYSLPEGDETAFCPGDKVCYADKKAAISQINQLQKEGRRTTERLRAYYCSQCAAWHLTKQMPW